MPKGDRYKAFLVSVVQRREALRTYAVVKPSATEALEAVEALSATGTKAYVVGGLSRDVIRRLKLRRDDIRLV
ncbi:hypothetical protein [Methylobacterium planeticum]|uniref:Uncharacterized protein n=1 Tax=Methylobacterium planeticum TaxID=2615211 RepID=A0A6N6MX05_9HYPH|nr:hypothetical protein [Methylobacterium planeticum]KAB1073639.1 hypothetical protein F6X51_10620 [Methylobacterium planeticum]